MNKITALAIALTVGVVMIGSVLMPVLNDASDGQRTVYNNTITDKYSLLYDEDLDSINATIELRDYAERKVYVTMNGETNTVVATVRNSMFMSDKAFVRVDPSNSGMAVYIPGQSVIETASITLPFTITIVNGVVTLKDSASLEYTVTPEEWMFIPDVNGDYEIVSSTATGVYINSIDDLYFATIINTGNRGFAWGSDGKCTFYNTGETYDMFAQSIEKIEGYTDLYKINMADYCISTDAGTNNDDTPFCPFMAMVPASVDAHTELNNSVLSMLAAIPIMFVVALIAISAIVIMRRD